LALSCSMPANFTVSSGTAARGRPGGICQMNRFCSSSLTWNLTQRACLRPLSSQ
jgi:hypothetical protein